MCAKRKQRAATAIALLGLLIALSASCASRPGRSEFNALMAPFIGKWIYVRASEASVLFLEEGRRGRESYFSIRLAPDGRWRLDEEEPGRPTRSFVVAQADTADKGVTLRLYSDDPNAAVPSQVHLYPYWDIPGAYVSIWRYDDAEVNPVRFFTRSSQLGAIPYLKPDG